MEISKVKSGKFCALSVSYKNEIGDTITFEGVNECHPDMVAALKKLTPHFAIIAEQREAMNVKALDDVNPNAYVVLNVTGFVLSVSESGEESVMIIGTRSMKSKKVLNIITPLLGYGTESEYEFRDELYEVIEECKYEVRQYVEEQKWKYIQGSLDFGTSEGVSVAVEAMPFGDEPPTDMATEVKKPKAKVNKAA